MSKKQPKYTAEFRRQMIELHRVGRGFEALAQEYGVTSWTLRSWVKQAARDSGASDGGLTTVERQELTRLRRENRQLKMEREILSKAAAWFANESSATPKRASDL
jgi:transposase